MKGKKQTQGHILKRFLSFQNTINQRDEQRRKEIGENISKKTKGRIPWNKGLTISDDRVKKYASRCSITKKKNFKNLEYKNKVFAKILTPERARKISLKQKGVKKSLLHVEKMRINSLKQESQKSLHRLSKLELITIILLERQKISYERQKIINNCFCCDFLFDNNKIIEINGYWHKNGDEKDIEKKKYLEELGYVVYQIKVFDKEDLKMFEKKICEIIGG
jgi:very-short-patch-repair endonuclease